MRAWIERSSGLPLRPGEGRRFPGIAHVFQDMTDQPCPSVLAGRPIQVVIEHDGSPPPKSDPMKPPYRVPSMAEIAAIPHNGFTAVSTFSGCGGSCLGYRMAGFRVAWASEFIPAAQETYRANHPGSILDTRDIRQVQPEEILEAIGKAPGELDLLDGSPPCASFSTAGKREAGWGKVKTYSETRQRSDDLFFEYGRLLRGLRPKVFVAENVSGLVKGTAKGYFLEILANLKAAGYRVEARVLDASWLGVPQSRQRLIFVGVREDLGLAPAFPRPLPYRYSVRDALPWLSSVVHDTSGERSLGEVLHRPSPTITVGGQVSNACHFKVSGPPVEAEADISRYAIGREWHRTPIGASSSKYLNLKRSSPDAPSFGVSAEGGNPSAASVTHPTECRKFSIAELRRICGFPDDFVLTGTYAQQWERLGRAVPPVMMAAIAATVREEVLCRLPK